MKYLLILSLLILSHASATNTNRRTLHPKSKSSKRSKNKRPTKPNKRPSNTDGGLVCIDLGSRGHHTFRTSAKLRALTSFRRASKGKCSSDTKLKSNLLHSESYCREFNHKMVTIRAPEGLRPWLVDVVGAKGGGCRDRDEVIVMREV